MSKLKFDWVNAPLDVTGYTGFVYRITNIVTGKMYIGQKRFFKKVKLKPLKGNINQRHRLKQSNWQDYWGSCTELLNDITRLGKSNFKREMLILARSNFMLSYSEVKLQLELDVLFSDKYYNQIINCRLKVSDNLRFDI